MSTRTSVFAWTFDASEVESALPSLERVLTADEVEKVRRLVRPDVRRTSAASRGVLRCLLAAQIGCGPEEVPISYNGFGKPQLPGEAALFFNVSHCGDRIAVALGFGAEVGIDIERVRESEDWPELARRYFAPREAEYIHSVPSAERNRAFFEIWTRKEAYIKALGRGLSVPLTSFCVPLGPIAEGEGALIDDGSGLWEVRSLRIDDDFAGAAVVRAGARLEHHRGATAILRAIDSAPVPDGNSQQATTRAPRAR